MKYIIYYLGYLPKFVPNQGFPKAEIIKLTEFALPHEGQKHLLVQGHEWTGNDLYKLVEFCKHLEIFKEVYNNKCDDTNPNKKPN